VLGLAAVQRGGNLLERGDDAAALERGPASELENVEIEVVGAVALFAARA
jgi:hypothetical protein